VEHLGVGEYPAFHVHPYLALWAVQSKKAPGQVGWWTVTGDLPADYIGSSEGKHPREALRAFARRWREASELMLRGERHPDYSIGTPDQRPELGDLLQRRAEIIPEVCR
jgi:non-ribosomal peptide synthetase component F